MNLCTNAIDAMQPSRGKLNGKLEIGLFNFNDTNNNNHSQPHSSAGHIKLTITDTGQGMSRKEIASIFDPFYTTKGQDEGIGLGLSITRRIIEHHGGNISVNSIVGVGTSFAVLLPRQEQIKVDEDETQEISPNYLATRESMYA